MKIAVIGCGNIANAAHFPALAKIEDAEILYAVDILEDRARAAAEKYGAKQAIADYRVALADPAVEAVFVLTPNYMHYKITMDALAAGKHVFCEKPITVDGEKSREMQRLAAEKNLILNIGVCNRFHRSVEMIKEMADNGDLGEIYHVYCSFRSYRSIPGLGGSFTDKSQSGGGVLIDWGVHFLDLILYITGVRARAVSADCYSKLARRIEDYHFIDMWAGPPKADGVNDVEEFVTGHVRTDGASISLNGAWAQNIDKNEMFVDFLGTKGGVRLDYGSSFTLYTEKNGVLEEVRPHYNIPNMYEAEDRAFFESVASGEKTRGHIDNVIGTAYLMDAIYASSAQGKEVTL